MKNFFYTVAGGLTVALVSHLLLRPVSATEQPAPKPDGSRREDYAGESFALWANEQI